MENSTIQYYKRCAGIEYNPDQEGLNLFAELIITDLEEQITNLTEEIVRLKREQYPQFDNTVTFFNTK